jgi:hypothetical protein
VDVIWLPPKIGGLRRRSLVSDQKLGLRRSADFASAWPSYKEGVVDQLKGTSRHNGSMYARRAPQTFVTSLASGVLSQGVSNDFHLLLLMQCGISRSRRPKKKSGPAGTYVPAGPFQSLRSHSEYVIEADRVHQ